jgi:hypothetical protein
VLTHGTPQHIINDPVAIQHYLGQNFNDNMLGGLDTALPGRRWPMR